MINSPPHEYWPESRRQSRMLSRRLLDCNVSSMFGG
jgi:hypothetical protein